MEKNEIKKALYKESPIATIMTVSKDGMIYRSVVQCLDNLMLTFHVPINDIGDATFCRVMEAKHLIRWMILPIESDINPKGI